jgi:hypothetical protein
MSNEIMTLALPQTRDQMFKLAEWMAGARLVPRELQKSPADCLMVIQQAMRWEMDPFAVAQECSVINGRLMHSGKLVAAVINAKGNLRERLDVRYSGQGDDRKALIFGTLQGETEPREIEVDIKKARTKNPVWQTQPDQQLFYFGARMWARRHVPELMLGVYSPDEFEDEDKIPTRPIRDITPRRNYPDIDEHDSQEGNLASEPEQAAESFSQESRVEDDSADTTGFTETLMKYDSELAAAAESGDRVKLEATWKVIPHDYRESLRAALDNRHWPRMRELEKATGKTK